MWKRTNSFLGQSKVIVEWHIPANQAAGTYRIRHFGHYKSFWGGRIKAYSGESKTFRVSIVQNGSLVKELVLENGKQHNY